MAATGGHDDRLRTRAYPVLGAAADRPSARTDFPFRIRLGLEALAERGSPYFFGDVVVGDLR